MLNSFIQKLTAQIEKIQVGVFRFSVISYFIKATQMIRSEGKRKDRMVA
jgi:hypothetical protein